MQISRNKDQVQRLATSARRCALLHIQQRDTGLKHIIQLLNAFSYKGVLERGFALVRDTQDIPLHAAADISAGQRLSIEFADGRINATAETGATTPSKSASKSTSRRATDFGVKKTQGDLF